MTKGILWLGRGEVMACLKEARQGLYLESSKDLIYKIVKRKGIGILSFELMVVRI